MKRFIYMPMFVLASAGILLLVGCQSGGEEDGRARKSPSELTREELKREIIEELRGELLGLQTDETERIKNALEKVLLAKLEKMSKEVPGWQIAGADAAGQRRLRGPVGNASGSIKRAGVSLSGCKIKLVKLLAPAGASRLSGYQEGEEFITTTNLDGRYVFRDIPVGDYKVKWQLPGDKGWIRRLQDKPDVTVKENKDAILRPIETSRRLVEPQKRKR